MGACGSKKSDAVAEQPTSNPQEQEGGPAAATPAVVKATDKQADSAVDGGDVQVQDGEQVTQQEGSELTYALPVAHKENKQGIALSEACTGTDVEAVRKLLDAGAPIDYWDRKHMPPLTSVLAAKQYMMRTEMQFEGTSAEECNFPAREAIFALLLEKSSPAVLDQVFSFGEPSDKLSFHSTALHQALEDGFTDEANLLIDHGASGNIPAKIDPAISKTFTAIECVAMHGPRGIEFFDTVQRIMWRLDEWTPLHAAAVWGKTEKFIELLEAGAVDMQARTKTRQLTAMELAKYGGTDFGTTGKNMEVALATWKEQRLDGLTKLLNKGAFLGDVAKLEARGIEPAFFSIDIQGFKGVNDTIDHVAGDGALHYYAALLSSVVKEASTDELKGVVYRTGGDELSVIWSKASGAPRDGFRQKVEAVAQTLAKVDHVVKGEKDGTAVEAPTFLRIGVGPTHHLADQAETEIRSQVYMKAFGSLDARGQMVSRSDARLEGVATWMAAWEATDKQADSAVDGGDVQVQDGEQVTQQEGSELTYALPVAHKENKQGIALSEACTGTDVEAVRKLLDAGAPIDYWDRKHMPPLTSVLAAKQYMMRTEMQFEGTSAEECNFPAREAIFALLLEKSSPAVLDQVFSFGEPSDKLSFHSTALHQALEDGFTDEANLLIDHGASGNIPAKIDPAISKTFTAIECVAMHGPRGIEFFDTVQRIMWRLDEWTPLHAAAVWGKTEKFIELLEAGAVDMQARTKTRQLTAMELAKYGGTDFGTTGKNMEVALATWKEQRLDGLTKLLNKGAFLGDVAKLEARGIEPAFFSIDIQGFKGVNDTIDHVAGDGALHYYAALLSSVVKEASTDELKGVVYRTGGDELSVIWSKASGAPRDGFRQKVEAVAQTLAKVDHVVKGEKDGTAVEAPTFLRIGVGPTHHLADQAETEIRSQVYMKAFGSLDARGQMVSRSDARLEGVATWMAAWEARCG